jgi:hypothetical protein
MVNGETWGFIMVKKHVLYIDDSWLLFFSGKKNMASRHIPERNGHLQLVKLMN